MSIAAAFCDWAYSFKLEGAPQDVAADGRYRLLDVAGLCLAAAPTALGRAVHDGCEALAGGAVGSGGLKASTVIGFGTSLPPAYSAMINATLAHAMDFDDTHLPSLMHPSAPVASAALALAEMFGRSGADVLTALVVGNELACRLCMAAPGAFHSKGLHPTGVLSPPVVALIASQLMGLDRGQALNAMGIACSQGSGLLEAYQDGSWVKTLHPGWAAHGGISAAFLARAGFTGPATGLDGRFGLLRAMLDGPGTDLDTGTVVDGLGSRWESRSNFYKLYPFAQVLLPFAEMAMEIRRETGGADTVTEILAEIPARYIPVVCEPRAAKIAPHTNTHARASLAYAVAVALVRGSAGIDDYSDTAIFEPDVLRIAALVTHAQLDPVPAGDGFAGALTVKRADGSSRRLVQVSRKGHPGEVDTPGAVAAKFRDNAGRRLPPDAVEALFSKVITVDSQADMTALLALTSPVGA
ncbi:MAG: MmgE/PrpD family protein [Alphaproteobacteria bacterium]|nr:MmgE/PrpD family protein [Alphaproteobacteria bacterium]